MGCQMKLFMTIVFLFSISTAYAGEKLQFIEVPHNIANTQVITAMKKAAVKRKWTASELADEKLQVTLNHHGYKAKLIFSFSGDHVLYEDFTTSEDSDEYDSDEFDSNGKEKEESVPVPKRWLTNLRRDTLFFLERMQRRSAPVERISAEELTSKLENLKKLYDKKLITESEYLQKKKEVMSRY